MDHPVTLASWTTQVTLVRFRREREGGWGGLQALSHSKNLKAILGG